MSHDVMRSIDETCLWRHGRSFRSSAHLMREPLVLGSGENRTYTWPFCVQVPNIFLSRSSCLALQNKSDDVFVRCSDMNTGPPGAPTFKLLLWIVHEITHSTVREADNNWLGHIVLISIQSMIRGTSVGRYIWRTGGDLGWLITIWRLRTQYFSYTKCVKFQFFHKYFTFQFFHQYFTFPYLGGLIFHFKFFINISHFNFSIKILHFHIWGTYFSFQFFRQYFTFLY